MATKLYAPQLRRGLVPRPRLLALLERGIQTRLTLVSAPAGFGKTTLLGESLQTLRDEDHRLAWLSLDPADDDPGSFWTYVVTALGTALPRPQRRAAGADRLHAPAHRADADERW